MEDLNNATKIEMYILARWFYKEGKQIMSDSSFDIFEEEIKDEFPDFTLPYTSYADDDKPVEILKKFGMLTGNDDLFSKNTTLIKNNLDMLLDNKALSIRPIRTYEEAYYWFQDNEGAELLFSPKFDGVFIKGLLDIAKGRITVAASKGRKSQTLLDYTETVQRLYPRRLKARLLGASDGTISLKFEGLMTTKGREILNKTYNANFVNAKTSGASVLQKGATDEILRELRVLLHDIEDSSEKLSISYEQAKNIGLDPVPYELHTFKDNGFEEFKEWIDNIQDRLNCLARSMDLEFDGVVVQINSKKIFNEKDYNELYSSANIALKFGNNESAIILAKVRDIRLEFEAKSKEKHTAKIYLEPVFTNDNKRLSKVSGYNLDYIIRKGIKVGDEIEILYQSGCDPILK